MDQGLFVCNTTLGFQVTGAGEGWLVPWLPCQRGREGQTLIPEPPPKEWRSFCKHLGRWREVLALLFLVCMSWASLVQA